MIKNKEHETMSRVCEICNKKKVMGNSIKRRGLAKKKGGIGKKTTGITRREFRPNLQSVRALVNGAVKRVKVCTRCLKSGKVVKA